MKKNYQRSDLACEMRLKPASGKADGVYVDRYRLLGTEILKTHITEGKGEELTGKAAGTYYTVFSGKLWLLGEEEYKRVREATSEIIRTLTETLVPTRKKGGIKILIAGLGNRFITSDAVGPFTIDRLVATRHLKHGSDELFELLGGCEVSLIAPGVIGQTGFESAEMIQSAASCSSPDLVLVIDALAARSCQRLGTTIQLSDTGLRPGSGIGNHRKSIDRTTMGAPVLSIGIPTVVSSATLIAEALEQSEIEQNEALEKILCDGESFFVSLKESDIVVAEAAKLLSEAITEAFQT